MRSIKIKDPLKKLMAKLLAINIACIALVIIVLCVFAWRQGTAALEDSYFNSFAGACDLLQSEISRSSQIDHKAIYEYAAQYNLIPFIFDGENEILNPYISYENVRDLPQQSEAEIADALQQKASQAGQWQKLPVTKDFFTQADGRTYFSRYIAFTGAQGEWIDIYIYKDAADYQSALSAMLVRYILLAAGGFLLLSALTFCVIYFAMQPAINARKSEKEFLAAASHELKTPLAVIITSVELIMQNDNSGNDETDERRAKRKTYCNNILSEAKNMSALVADLLAVSKSDIAVRVPLAKAVDTEKLLLDAFEKLEPLAQQSEHELALDLPKEELTSVCGSEEQLLQVLSILISNAVSYTPKGSKITLSATQIKGYVQFSVADNGGGVQDTDKIFEKFYRENSGIASQNSTSDKDAQALSTREHLGLGLSIAKNIVTAHSGTITAENSPTGGAVFTFKIPIEK